MIAIFRQLLAYDAWADAQHLHVLFIHEPAYADPELRQKMEHIHAGQRAFLALLHGHGFDVAKLNEPFATPEELAASARLYHLEMRDFAAGWTEDFLRGTVEADWMKDNPVTRADVVLQSVLHGQSHRAQNASRMRALAWKPPLTDFIVWVSKGQPEPDWPH